jgi:hypothetical protein
LRRSKAEDVDAVLDASFIKAWSIRHPKDSQKGFSDKQARVGRTGRTFGLGYKLHLSIDSQRMLPLTSLFAPANQKSGVKSLLRVDKKFRAHGPEDQKRKYHERPSIEAVYSFLKTQYSLAINKVRCLKNVAVYALCSMLCLVLIREAAENIGRPYKTVSPTYFNTQFRDKVARLSGQVEGKGSPHPTLIFGWLD